MNRRSTLPRWRRVAAASTLVVGAWVAFGAASASAGSAAGHRPPVMAGSHVDGRGGNGNGNGNGSSASSRSQAQGKKVKRGARWS